MLMKLTQFYYVSIIIASSCFAKYIIPTALHLFNLVCHSVWLQGSQDPYESCFFLTKHCCTLTRLTPIKKFDGMTHSLRKPLKSLKNISFTIKMVQLSAKDLFGCSQVIVYDTCIISSKNVLSFSQFIVFSSLFLDVFRNLF